jgi:acyl carrier protein
MAPIGPRTVTKQLLTQSAIEQWLVEHVALALRIDPSKVVVDAPFADYALDSVTALRLVGQMEDLVGRELEPTLLYDYRDIASLSTYLASEST